MKRILLTVTVLALSCAQSFAQPSYSKPAAAPAMKASQPATTSGQPAMKADSGMMKAAASMSANGTVESVTPADVAAGTKSELIVTLDDASKKTFVINDTTTIYDTTGKALALKDLTPAAKVKLSYVEKDGANEAVSVHQM